MNILFFDPPDDWLVCIKVGDVDCVDSDGDYVDTVLMERLIVYGPGEETGFDAEVSAGGDMLDILEEMSLDDLKEYLKKNNRTQERPEELLKKCKIAGRDAYYFIMPNTDNDGAVIRMKFDTPNQDVVFLDARIQKITDADWMIGLLERRLFFRK